MSNEEEEALKAEIETALANDGGARNVFEAVKTFIERIQKRTGVLDKNRRQICFGDTLRFADKVEWYRSLYSAKVQLGIMTKEEAISKIETLPYEERKVESIADYEWLLSEDTQKYWEVV